MSQLLECSERSHCGGGGGGCIASRGKALVRGPGSALLEALGVHVFVLKA